MSTRDASARRSVTSLPSRPRVSRADPTRRSARLPSRKVRAATPPEAEDPGIAEMEAAIGQSLAALTPSPLTKTMGRPSGADEFEVHTIAPTLDMRMRMSMDTRKELESTAGRSSPGSSPAALSMITDLSDTDDDTAASPNRRSPTKPAWALGELGELPQPSPGWNVIPAHQRPQGTAPRSPAIQVSTVQPPLLCSSPMQHKADSPLSAASSPRPASRSSLGSPGGSPTKADAVLARIQDSISHQEQLGSSSAVLSTVRVPSEVRASAGWGHSSMRLSTDRLDSIFSFLDQVDCEALPSKPLEELPVQQSLRGECGARMGEMYGGVKAKMEGMKRELATQAAQIDALQIEMSQKEEQRGAERKSMIEEHEKHLEAVRAELEGAIARNLEFMDRLLADKEELNSKCGEMTKQLTEVESRWVAKMKQFESECQREVAQAKAQREATEQLRRNKWQASKEKEIKEITIKGLEPEIERMLAKHKADLAAALQSHEEAIKRVREEQQQHGEELLRKERSRHRDEVDAAIERERSMASEQLRQVSLRHEAEMAAQRQRMISEFQGDATHKESSWRERVRSQEESTAELRRELEEARDVAKRELRRQLSEKDEAHEHQIEQQQHQFKMQRAEYKQNMREELHAEFELAMQAKLQEATARLTAERDEEIEMVIQRLEEETREQVKAAEGRNAALVTQGAKDVEQAREKEEEWMERYRSEVTSRAGLEDELRQMEARLGDANSQLESLLARQNELSEELHAERVRAHTAVREAEDEVRKQRTGHECEMIAMKKTLLEREASIKAVQRQHNEDVAALTKANADELDRVNQRVRQVVEKKDDTITRLRQQLTATERQALQIESLLEPTK